MTIFFMYFKRDLYHIPTSIIALQSSGDQIKAYIQISRYFNPVNFTFVNSQHELMNTSGLGCPHIKDYLIIKGISPCFLVHKRTFQLKIYLFGLVVTYT